jgi:hypothetical protein
VESTLETYGRRNCIERIKVEVRQYFTYEIYNKNEKNSILVS